ncbi:metal ABC transporter permease [Thalassobaculum sp.]|uniref:metal ABC transporter permease n=2 Tax=Thalassobaculum sp. TaxID=2022740 RepID=UPI0032EEE65E
MATGTTMLDDFLVRALVAGVGVALVAGPLGCFVVWRRMAYVGDTMAHASLLGIALGLILGLDLGIGVLAVTVTVALLLAALQGQRLVGSDTLLGILAHGALSIGLVAVAFMETVRLDLMAYLFGDILAVSARDLLWIWGGSAMVLAGLAAVWRPLLAATVDPDLARAERASPPWVQVVFALLIAGTIAIAMKIVGVLLITALLIIPAAAARRSARSPEGMAAAAAGVGVVAVLGGLALSIGVDTPSGPSIVVAALVLFVGSLAIPARG